MADSGELISDIVRRECGYYAYLDDVYRSMISECLFVDAHSRDFIDKVALGFLGVNYKSSQIEELRFEVVFTAYYHGPLAGLICPGYGNVDVSAWRVPDKQLEFKIVLQDQFSASVYEAGILVSSYLPLLCEALCRYNVETSRDETAQAIAELTQRQIAVLEVHSRIHGALRRLLQGACSSVVNYNVKASNVSEDH